MDLLVLFGVVVALTVLAYLLATLGTKEVPFEEAIAEQRQKRDMENASSKPDKQHKKPKVKKVKGKKDEAEVSSSVNAPEAESETEATSATLPLPPSPPVHKPETEPLLQPTQEKKKEKKKKEVKPEEGHRKINVEEVQLKAVKVQATPEPAPVTAPEPAALKENKKEAKKDVKEVKNQTKEVKKDAKEVKKDAKEVKKDAKEVKKDAKEVKKDTKEVKKDAKEVKKDAKEVKKDITKEVKKDAKEVKDNKETKKDNKEAKKESKEEKEGKDTKEVKEAKRETKESKKPVVEAAVIAAVVEVQEVAVDSSMTEQQASPQDKKKKKDKPKNDITNMNEAKLLPMVQRAPLSGTEIQTLIDVLLNKQQQNNAGGDWVKKGRVDPITLLKRQLEEVENRLRDKDEAHSALSAKITDLCSDLHGERSRASKLKVQLDDTMVNHTRQQETAANTAKAQQASCLKELRTTLEQEYTAKLQQQQQLIEQLQNASSENEVTTLQTSLNEAKMQATMLQQEHEKISQQCQQYEEHIRVLKETSATEDASRTAQLTDLQAQLQKSDAARAQALAELSAMDSEHESLNAQVASYTSKNAQFQHNLQEKIHEKTEVDSRLIQVESELRSVRQVVVDQNIQIERLKDEKESLASQSVRPAAEGQENGDVHSEHPDTPDTAHLQSIVKEKDRLIEEQVSEVANLNKEVSRLKEDFENQREKNNELREKNHTVLEALTITEEKLMARLKQVDEASGIVEEEKTKVRAVLRRIFPEVVVDDALDQGAFLSEFETKALQVATQTAQQPEPQVVEKVVEVIKVVEKEVKVEDPKLKSRVEELSKENAELKSQVTDLEKSSVAVDDSQRVSELEDEVRTITEKVAHYQTVLADTEDLLKSLQASVESEEVAWTKRLSEKETELKQLVADKANLSLQVKQLEDTLEKVKKAEDMQEQLGVLKEQLQEEEKEKVSLLEKLQKAQEQLAQTVTQGGGDSDEASVLDLKAANDKLRALVNVGQDASRQQDELIEQLQKELAATKTVSTNGPANEEQSHEGTGATQ